METVAFYSYKGGVGRTLLVANTAQFLAAAGRKVVALDLDLEAPGLHQKLGNDEVLRRADAGTLTGAVDELLASLEGESRSVKLGKTAIPIDLPAGATGRLHLVSAGSAPSQAYWSALERLQTAIRTGGRHGGLLEAILELQARIADDLAPDFLLIDSRTGITELGGLATSVLADRVICLTTMAEESIKGTRVVAQALGAAPRLKSQAPLRVEFLITRIVGSSRRPNVQRLTKELNGQVAVLPHDSGIAEEERVIGNWRPHAGDRDDRDRNSGKALYAATLDWIAESFPLHKPQAESTKLRMAAIHSTWDDLTRITQRDDGGYRSRDAWPDEQLRERVRFSSKAKSRQADIVVYASAPTEANAKPLMIVEYVEGEDRDLVAKWWFQNTEVKVLALLSADSHRRLYSDSVRWESRVHHSDRWDLPLPRDFVVLIDPTDVSVEAMLASVRRGHDEYLDRLIREWMRCSAATLHGGAPWRPDVAKKIVDGLAQVDDVDLACRVLWRSGQGRTRHRMHDGHDEDGGVGQVDQELFAPLLWRVPAEAAVKVLEEHGGPFGPPLGRKALTLLAADILGLRYDPDASFRAEGQSILERGHRVEGDSDGEGLYSLTSAFRGIEISFEISDEPPSLASVRLGDDEGTRKHRRRTRGVPDVVAERIGRSDLVTTGLLGDYEPAASKVLLYTEAIAVCADKLALRARYVGSVTLIHETMHALMHLGTDLDGRRWTEFSLPDAGHPLFEPSKFHETLAQYFTYQHILRLRDPALMNAFKVMSAKQAPAYRAWESLVDLPMEDARAWFMNVRRGVGPGTPPSYRHGR